MLISHAHKFIFIKTRKTAGTSIEVDLAKHLGPKDIATPVTPPEPGHTAQNHRNPNWFKRKFLKQNYYNHIPASRVRLLAGEAVFNDYFKFCFEREPVSKCLSMYAMMVRDAGDDDAVRNMTWDEYVERGDFPEDSYIYCDDDGSLLVDRILKFERLDEEFSEVCAQLGVPLNRVAAQAKRSSRKSLDVTDKHRQIIYDAFAPSLVHTGYTP